MVYTKQFTWVFNIFIVIAFWFLRIMLAGKYSLLLIFSYFVFFSLSAGEFKSKGFRSLQLLLFLHNWAIVIIKWRNLHLSKITLYTVLFFEICLLVYRMKLKYSKALLSDIPGTLYLTSVKIRINIIKDVILLAI